MSEYIVDENILPSNMQSTGLEINVSAPGKVILHGEHSVVFGRLALAAALGIRSKVKIIEIDTPNVVVIQAPSLDFVYTFQLKELKNALFNIPLPLTCEPSEYNWEHAEFIHYEILLDRIEKFIEYSIGVNGLLPQKATFLKSLLYLLAGFLGSVEMVINSLSVVITTDLTLGAGTGSSASYLVALAGALVQYVKSKSPTGNFSKPEYKPSTWATSLDEFNEQELSLICKWSFCGEKIIHGQPSGIDNTICTYGMAVEFRKGLVPKSIYIAHPFKILLIDTKVQRECRVYLVKTAKLHEKYPDLVTNILNAMEDVAFIALKQIEILNKQTLSLVELTNIYNELGMLFSTNHSLLNALGAGHIKLEEVMVILAQHGFSGKLTGAGGGGNAIALVPPYVDNNVVDETIKHLESEGFRAVCAQLGGEGVTVD